MYKPKDIIKFEDGTFGVLKKRKGTDWKVSTSLGYQIAPESSFTKFDKQGTVSKIRMSLKEVDWTKLEDDNTKCPDCLKLIRFMKNLAQYGDINGSRSTI